MALQRTLRGHLKGFVGEFSSLTDVLWCMQMGMHRECYPAQQRPGVVEDLDLSHGQLDPSKSISASDGCA